MFLVWLVLLLLFIFLVKRLFGPVWPGLFHEDGIGQHVGAFKSLYNWDGQWFLAIAKYGYASVPARFGWDIPYVATAFFPLYPLAIRLFSYPLLGNFYAAGLTVSWLSLLGSLVYLYRLARIYGTWDDSYRSCLFLLLFPTSIFLIAGYAEALLLLCAVAAFYHARRSSWVLAGVWGFLACLTKSMGLLVFVGVALEAFRQAGWKFSGLRRRMAAIALMPLGSIAYMVYLQIAFGDFKIFTKAEEVGWGRRLDLIGILRALKHLIIPSGLTGAKYAENLYLVFFVGLFALLIVYVFKWYGLPMGAFSLGWLLMIISVGSTDPGFVLMSANRLILPIFPAFLVLGRWGKDRRFEQVYVVAGTLGLALFTTLFITGFWAG